MVQFSHHQNHSILESGVKIHTSHCILMINGMALDRNVSNSLDCPFLMRNKKKNSRITSFLKRWKDTPLPIPCV